MHKSRRRALIASAVVAGLAVTSLAWTSATAANPGAAGANAPTRSVIVLLRNQHTDLQAAKGVSSPRALAAQRDQGPLLEPEALQTTHTAFTDPSTPQARSLATGRGVRVAWIADGIDVDNPDFIRPDGSHVIVDYQDFSGEGLAAPTGANESFGDAS